MSNDTFVENWNLMSDGEQNKYIEEAKEHVPNFSSIEEPFLLDEKTKQAIQIEGYHVSDFDSYQLASIQNFVQCGLDKEFGHKFINPTIDDMIMQVVMCGIKDKPEYHYELVLPYLFNNIKVSTADVIRKLCLAGRHDFIQELVGLWHSGEYDSFKLIKIQKLMAAGLEYKDIINASDFNSLFSSRLLTAVIPEYKENRETERAIREGRYQYQSK